MLVFNIFYVFSPTPLRSRKSFFEKNTKLKDNFDNTKILRKYIKII